MAATYSIKNFWINPRDLPVTAKELSFGYTDNKGKKKEYKVSVKNNDIHPFHEFTHALYMFAKKIISYPGLFQLSGR